MQKAREKIRPPKGGQNLVKVLAICHLPIFCYLMLVLKVGFNYWIYSIGLTILVIDIFLLVMSRVEDNDDNDTENKAR